MIRSKLIFTFSVLLAGVLNASYLSVHYPNDPDRQESIKTFDTGNTTYISTTDFVRVLNAGIFSNVARGKVVIYFGGHRIKVSAHSSFVVIDNQVYQMPTYSLSDGSDIYLPMRAFIGILHRHAAPGISYDSGINSVVVELITHNITGLDIEEKANGTVIRIATTEQFDEGSLTGWSARNRWFYLTVSGGIADSVALRKATLAGVVRGITVDQTGRSVQVAFQLRNEIEDFEVYQNHNPNEIVLTLRSPLSYSADKIKKLRDAWYIDTIIIDAGHGGKDPGTTGKYGLREKFVTLDIAKRLGRLVERNTNAKVVYTRDEDVFVPLWERTKIANESNGKLFISIHANANKNRRVKGFETFILRPGKTADAVELAERENSVIKLEEEASRYDHLTEDSFIIASLMQNAFMKESEDLAAMVQSELRKNIPSPDRGVKQAGFYVLIGASMPHAYLEVGFLSNPLEEKQLRKPGYRQSIAQAAFNGIRRFKDKYERVLADEG